MEFKFLEPNFRKRSEKGIHYIAIKMCLQHLRCTLSSVRPKQSVKTTDTFIERMIVRLTLYQLLGLRGSKLFCLANSSNNSRMSSFVPVIVCVVFVSEFSLCCGQVASNRDVLSALNELKERR